MKRALKARCHDHVGNALVTFGVQRQGRLHLLLFGHALRQS